jgi:excisionase family DNA binding protein
MTLKTVPFKEPIYTRRASFNHTYDVTLNEITKEANNNAYSDFGYASALFERLKLYSAYEKKLFLAYQLKRSANPLRWLLDFELLVELNNWKSEFEFLNYRAEELLELPNIIRALFIDIENGKYDCGVDSESENNTNEAVFNTAETCAYLNISKSTLYKLTSKKTIAFYKPGGKNMYFKKEDLDAFMTKSKQISNSELETQTNNYLSRGWKP